MQTLSSRYCDSTDRTPSYEDVGNGTVVSSPIVADEAVLGGDYYPDTGRSEILRQGAVSSGPRKRADQDVIDRNCAVHNARLGGKIIGVYMLAATALSYWGVNTVFNDNSTGNEATTEVAEPPQRAQPMYRIK